MELFESFRAVRWLRTLNLVLQAVLFLTLFGGLNYLARNHSWRFDLTRQRKYSLSPETLSYIRDLSQPVHIVITLSDDNYSPEVRGLIDEYVNATKDGTAAPITKEYLDVYQNRRRAEELGIGDTDLIVMNSGEKRRSLFVDELYRMKDRKRAAFQGEQALTAALLDVSSPGRKKIYFLVGHGEMQPADPDPKRGLSTLRDQLRVRNFDVDTLELATARRVPADAALVVGVAPSLQSSYTPAEQEMLRQYLGAQAGRLLLFLPPGAPIARLGLDDLLLDWGVLVDDDLVWDVGGENMTDDNDLMLRTYDEAHPVVESLVATRTPLRSGFTRSVRPDPGRSRANDLNVVPIIMASETAWGEVSYMARTVPHYDRGVDIRPIPGMKPDKNLSVAVASERVAVRDNLPFSVPGGRLIVFGTGDLVSNQRIGNNGNFAAFLGAVNWAVDRDRQLAIPPRPIERFSLALSAAEFLRLRYALLLALPGATLLLGLIVYWTRRV